jgi:hypothetical protein
MLSFKRIVFICHHGTKLFPFLGFVFMWFIGCCCTASRATHTIFFIVVRICALTTHTLGTKALRWGFACLSTRRSIESSNIFTYRRCVEKLATCICQVKVIKALVFSRFRIALLPWQIASMQI